MLRFPRRAFAIALLICCCFAAAYSGAAAQTGQFLKTEFTQKLSARDSVLKTGVSFVNPQTFSIRLDSAYTLQTPLDYSLDTRTGIITFTPHFFKIFAQRDSAEITIYAEYVPAPFLKEYRRREIVYKTTSDSSFFKTPPRQQQATFLQDNQNFQRSGSIVRGFSVGSNRDLCLTSGLRLQFSGNVGSGMELRGVLSDDNIPIQPEGTTQTLQEFDKVFIEMQSKYVSTTLGDFNLSVQGSEFASFQRKLQGVTGRAEYEGGSVEVSGALTRGKFNTMQFSGIEGVQGPYRLRGRNNESDIIVIAGTERVFVDGILQVRGENNDYIIDYNTAQIFFKTRRMSTGFSRIVVDYEYSDFQFPRSLFSARTSNAFFNDAVRLSFTYLREGDDDSSPFAGTLSNSDRDILKSAGASRAAASRSGAVYVGYDSISGQPHGSYVLDSTGSEKFYRYAPGDPNAVWSVSFSYTGFKNGDYRRKALSQFEYVGAGEGDYSAVRFLPMPELRNNLAADLAFTPFKNVNFTLSGAGSDYSANRLGASSLQGGAYSARGEARFDDISFWGMNIPSVEWRGKVRNVEGTFTEFDRMNAVERSRLWNDSLAVQIAAREITAENSLSISPFKNTNLSGEWGLLQRGDFFQSVRTSVTTFLKPDSLPSFSARFDNIQSRDDVFKIDGSWQKIFAAGEYNYGSFFPTVKFAFENRHDISADSGRATPYSFRYTEFTPLLRYQPFPFLKISSETALRLDDLPINGVLKRESQSLTQAFGAVFSGLDWLSEDLYVGYRQRNFMPEFYTQRGGNISTLLLRSQTSVTPFKRAVDAGILYEIQTERSARQQRLFIQTVPGRGSFRYRGDENGNGIRDDFEFEQVRFDGDYVIVTMPTEELFPVVELRANMRLKLQPARVISDNAGNFLKVFKNISTETWVRVEERSSHDNPGDIYLLKPQFFQNEATTQSGSLQLQQDFFLFENSQDFSARLRFAERTSLAQYTTGGERAFASERSLRLRVQPVDMAGIQLDGGFFKDRISAPQLSVYRAQDIRLWKASADITTKFFRQLELGVKLEFLKGENRRAADIQQAKTFSQTLRAVYGIFTQGVLRTELEHTHVAAPENGLLPYHLTAGNPQGRSWIFKNTFEYRVGIMLFSLSYLGRIQPPVLNMIHTMQGEVRAFF
jgi:hypothetical protein